VKVRALFPLAAAAGLWIGSPATAQRPAPFPVAASNSNQVLADNVASRLQAVGLAAGADVSITVEDGTVTLTGSAKDAGQKERIIREVRGIQGVIVVRDGIRAAGLVQAQGGGGAIPAPLAPMPLAPQGGPPGNPIVEPAPLGVPGQFSPDMAAPNLPPHAWPTYAPYNNLSRVAYPTSHPYNAFPFIGPYYPFPKVPLGWRKVTLEWEDGHWYLGRNSTPQDYWRVRFW
jgi:hypothetical protein